MTATPVRSRGNLVVDLVAGRTTGIANFPDAMASAILAGANPVQGLYAIIALVQGASTRDAYAAAQRWLAERPAEPEERT